MTMEVSEIIRRWRNRSGLSQSQAAAALEVPKASLENWEQKRTTPRAPTLLKILKIVERK
jgi:DNA-binding transcriptional regulator YiaG